MTKSRLAYTLLSAALVTGLALFSLNCAGPGTMNGRVSLNITDQPMWGPTGYDRAEYYYIPDYDMYYSVSDRQYIYRDGTEWRYAATLPSSYSGYDPYHTYKVVLDEDRPYLQNARHRDQYRQYKGNRDQPVIRDSHDRRYFVNKDHPEHDKWVRDQH